MYVALPFWLGQYSYFNVRLAPVVYGFLALALAYVPVHRIVGYLCVAALIGLLLLTGRTHDRLSAETETILPILAKMERGATVLPIYFDASTQYLHRQAFYQFHSHDHYYYHLLVGGGANPTLWPNPMIPLQYKPGIFLPGLSEVSRVGWDQVLSAYRYVLIRNSSPDFVRSIDRHVKPVIRSGPWLLLEVQRNGDG